MDAAITRPVRTGLPSLTTTTIPDQFPISLRAWPKQEDKSDALSSLISRINVERGSFRNISEESLQDEIAKAEASEAISSGVESEEEDGDNSDRIKELTIAREEMLGQLEQAHQASLIALDFVSLLLSKDTPVQASLSISPALRDSVSLGTLGADKVRDSRVSDAQRRDAKGVAKGWKIQGIISGVDSILASASRLEKEIKTETKYWSEVLAIDEKGWAVCHLPLEKHTLGVVFGFAEAAPTFKNRRIAGLRRNLDGTIFLDHGFSDVLPQRVRVRIETDGAITGETAQLSSIHDSAPIESLVLRSRNSIFEEELWHELNRESRVLANQGVTSAGRELIYQINSAKRIILDLVPIQDFEVSAMSQSHADDVNAEIMSLSLHLLLSYAHRQNLHRRSQPPAPISNRPPPNPPYPLLRPIISRLHHESTISDLKAFVKALTKTLRLAGISTAPFALKRNQSQDALLASRKPIAEQIIEVIITHLDAEFAIPLTSNPLQSLTIRLRTAMFSTEKRFQITASGPISVSCKPPPNAPSTDEVKNYMLWAASCALAWSFVDASADEMETGNHYESQRAGISGWSNTHNPIAIRKVFANEVDGKEISFSFSSVGTVGVALEVRCKSLAHHTSTLEKAAYSPKVNVVEHIFFSEDNDDIEKATVRRIVEEAGRWTEQTKGSGEGRLPSDDGWDAITESVGIDLGL